MKKQHAHDARLVHDLKAMKALTERRQMLRLLAGATLLPFFDLGCADDAESDTTVISPTTPAGLCAQIPEETAGPYPGDGSNGPNVITASGIVRSDIRSSFGGLSGTAAGIPLTIELSLVAIKASCTALAGYAIYVWHCDRDGRYSLYTVPNQNYLRGVQQTDGSGKVTFTSIFPACYSGRWPHIHFEVYPSLAAATNVVNKIATSQIALTADACNAVYATSGYEQSVRNLSQVTLASDMVFSDGAALETPIVTGSVAAGYTASLVVGV